MEIRQNLKHARTSRGMTQEQAAERLHTTRQTISSYETGRTQPDIDTLLQLAEVYEVPLETLLYGDRGPDRRRRLHRAAWIVLACFLGGLLLLSVFLLVINRWWAIPGSGTITPELKPLFGLRFALLNARQAAMGLLIVLLYGALLVLVVLDVVLEGSRNLLHRIVFFLILTAGSVAVTLPWSVFDPVYGRGDYLFPLWRTVPASLEFLIVDLIICAVKQRKQRRQETPGPS